MADERSRVEASQALADQLGPAAAAALMECIPPFGWHEIATKGDMVLLKDDLRQFERRMESHFTAVDRRFDAIDYRFDAIDYRFDAFEAKIMGQLHLETARMLRWTIATVLGTITAVGAGVAAVAALVS